MVGVTDFNRLHALLFFDKNKAVADDWRESVPILFFFDRNFEVDPLNFYEETEAGLRIDDDYDEKA